MMALTDKPPNITKRGRCGIERLGLSEAEHAILDGWIGHYSDQAISDRLAEDDYVVSAQVVGRHRLRKCNCFR